MTEAQAKVAVLEKELKNTLLQLHAVQLQLHSAGEFTPDSNVIKERLVSCYNKELCLIYDSQVQNTISKKILSINMIGSDH